MQHRLRLPTYGDEVVEIHVERTIAAPPETVFDWLANPAHLTAAPLILRAGYMEGSSSPGAGAVRDALCVGMWLREQYTAYNAPRSYSYQILSAVPPMNHDGGTLMFTPTADGTRVEWETAFTHPIWAGGKALELITGPLVRSGFESILAGCAKALESS